MNKFSAIMSLGLVSLLAAGCVSTKPLQAEVDTLKTQVSRLEADHAALKTANERTAADAQAASKAATEAAAAAQTTANQAAAAAQTSQSCCDANSEKMERMFRRSVSK